MQGFTSGGALVTGQHWRDRIHDPGGGGGGGEAQAAISVAAGAPGSRAVISLEPLRSARAAGSRIQRWKVSIPALAHRTGCCRACHVPFEVGEPRLQSAASAQNARYLHPHCVPGGLGPVDEVEGLSELPEEAQAKMVRHCDQPGVTREEYQQRKRRRRESASLMDAEGIFDSQELNNLEWWDSIDIKAPLKQFVPTIARVPPQLCASFADARSEVLIAMSRLPPSACNTVEALRLEKLLTYMDRLLLCRPERADKKRGLRKRKAQQSPLASVLSARLRQFWRGEWQTLWSMASQTTATGQASKALTQEMQDERDAQRVGNLMEAGEVSRASSSVGGAAVIADGPETAGALRTLFPQALAEFAVAGDDMEFDPSQSEGSGEWRSVVAKSIQECIRRFPRMSGAGPAGSRFEHWGTLKDREDGMEAAGDVLARLLLGEVSSGMMEAHLSSRLIALRKQNGGVRPVACGSVLRRIAGKGACKAMKSKLQAACGDFQYGVGRSAGTETVHKTLTVLAAARPQAAFLSLDATNAFNSLDRNVICREVLKRTPELGPTAAAWYKSPAVHNWWDRDGTHYEIRAERGVDQGCPLSPAVFSMALAQQLDDIQSAVQALDSHARVLAYLDDIYIVVSEDHCAQALGIAQRSLVGLGLDLNLTKTHVWSPDTLAQLPAEIPRVAKMQCLGSTVPYVRAAVEAEAAPEEVASVIVGGGCPSMAVQEGFRTYVAGLKRLMAAGLGLQHALVLLRTYYTGAATHVMRAALVSESWCQEYDDIMFMFLKELVHHELDDSQLAQASLPVRDGGVGMSTTVSRRAAAFLGSWELCFKDVAAALGVATASEVFGLASDLLTTLTAAAATVQSQGADNYSPDWAQRASRQKAHVQRELGKAIDDARMDGLLLAMPDGAAADILSSGGPGGAYLRPAMEEGHAMSDRHFEVALRRRLRVPHPGRIGCSAVGTSHALTVTSMGASAGVTSTRRAIMQRYVRLVAAWCTGMTA